MSAVPATVQTLHALHRDWHGFVHEHIPDAIALRRRLHADPHLSGQEEPAAALLEQALGLPMERVAGTGRVGRLGPTQGLGVLLRAELDALPVVEETGVPYAAMNGAMHACGHDVHQAALVAVVAAAKRVHLPVGLIPLLQPREEVYPSGAQDCVEAHVLERFGVGAAVGTHVHPSVRAGAVATGAGVVNAAADEIEIVVRGLGGHAAYPHRAADPIAAIAHIALALPEIVRRSVSPMRPATLSVGHLHAGAPSANVLPSQARLLATMRTTHSEDRRRIQDQVARMATGQAEAFGVRAEVTITAGEPVLHNDPALVERMDLWLTRSGRETTEPMRSMGSDDFSFFGEVVPTVMAFVGVNVAGHVSPPQLHHPEFLPTDDAVLAVATAMVAGYMAGAELILAGGTDD